MKTILIAILLMQSMAFAGHRERGGTAGVGGGGGDLFMQYQRNNPELDDCEIIELMIQVGDLSDKVDERHNDMDNGITDIADSCGY